jgi:alpha-1,2-mannosyltransferase
MKLDRLSTRARVAVFVLALAMLASGFYFAGKSGSTPDAYSNDFNVYYHAAREILAGRDPYQHSLGDWTPYIYPPLLAELIVPLAILPLPVAAYVWFLVSAGSVCFAAWFSAGLAYDKRGLELTNQNNLGSNTWRAAIAACAVLLVFRFVLDTFALGQVNAVVAVLAVAHVLLYARDRKALSAIALMLAVSIKLTPALLLLYHVAKLRLRFAVACAALIVAVTALSFLPFGVRAADVFHEFWSRTVRNEQGYDFAYSGNQSLRGAIERLKGAETGRELHGEDTSREPADPLTLLVSIGLLSAAAFAAVRARGELAAAAPFFCGIVLLSPLSWKAHYVVLIPPAAYLLSLASRRGTARLLVVSLLAAAFLSFNLTSPRIIGLEAAEQADAYSFVFAGALLMFVGCVAWSRSQGSAEL